MILHNKLFAHQTPKPNDCPDEKYLRDLTVQEKATRDDMVDKQVEKHAAWVERHKEEQRLCRIEGCNILHRAGGYCQKHYSQRWEMNNPDRKRRKKLASNDSL